MTALATKQQMEFTGGHGSIAPTTAPHPLAILNNLVERGGDIAVIERMSALAERWQENNARENFARAIAAFQAECPQIRKDRTANASKFSFQYAGFDDVMRQIRPLLARYGIAITFTSPTVGDGMLTVVTRVRVGSHHEDSAFSVPIAKDMVVGDPQKFGATLSYAKRYSLCAALNIVVTNEDNEEALKDFIDEAELSQLRELLAKSNHKTDADFKKFLEWAGASTLSEITKQKFREAKPMLQSIINKATGEKK